MAILEENIAKGWKTVFDGDSNLTTAVPGGLFYGMIGSSPTTPYAVLSITPGQVSHTSGTTYYQNFTVEVKVYSSAGAVDAGGIRNLFLARFKHSTKGALSISGVERVIHLVWDASQAAQTEPTTKEAKDILVTQIRWQLILQGNTFNNG